MCGLTDLDIAESVKPFPGLGHCHVEADFFFFAGEILAEVVFVMASRTEECNENIMAFFANSFPMTKHIGMGGDDCAIVNIASRPATGFTAGGVKPLLNAYP